MLAGGCGGGSSSGSGGAGGQLSASDLTTKENAICEAAAGKFSDLQKHAITTPAQAVQQLDRTAALFDALTAQLRPLRPPDNLKAKWQAFIAAQQQRATGLDAAAKKGHQDPQAAVATLSGLDSQVGPGSPAAKAADALGVDFICI
jgi:hypothetical protein